MELRLAITDVGRGRLHVELMEFYLRGEDRPAGRFSGHRLYSARLAGELSLDDVHNLHLLWGIVGVILDEVDPVAGWDDSTLKIDFPGDVNPGATPPGG